LPGLLSIDPPFAAKVLTIVGLPPTPCRLDLFLLTALDFSPAVMLAAFAAGTHFGYDLPLFFDAFFRPHSAGSFTVLLFSANINPIFAKPLV
jgi:hypothetical protein